MPAVPMTQVEEASLRAFVAEGLGTLGLAGEGRPMPRDWALTPEGEETDDPIAAMAGALLGIGGHKGYGLAFMTDVLTGVLSGGGFDLTPYSDRRKLDVSHNLTAIDIGWFMEVNGFRARMDEFIDVTKSRAHRPGIEGYRTINTMIVTDRGVEVPSRFLPETRPDARVFAA